MRQRGIFEKVSDSGEWWIRYADATGRIRREKVGGWGKRKRALDFERKKQNSVVCLDWHGDDARCSSAK